MQVPCEGDRSAIERVASAAQEAAMERPFYADRRLP
jgi:hypothetical protein